MRRLLLYVLILFSSEILHGSEQSFTFYGFVRNDFYYNSRQNEESLDGIFHFFPKPVVPGSAINDINAIPQSEMLSIATRMGVNIKGGEYGNARINSKIEVDLAGAGATYFMMRIRQAYSRFDWQKTSLLIGQTWHPLWGDVFPTVVSFNAGSPFQPFSRNPQIRLTHQPVGWLTFTGAASWQMQTSSNGPQGYSPVYMKNARTPNLFAGLQLKHEAWTAGGGLDYKRLQPEPGSEISSLSAAAYLEYSRNLLTINSKTVLGNNLSDHVMIGGYARYYNPSENRYGYTNLTSSSSWLNIIYGKKWQVGIFGGYHQNLGSQLPMLWQNGEGNFTVYGRGFYPEQQELLDRMVRIAPFLMLTVKELTFGVEYNYTMADYGKIQFNGKVNNPYTIDNHRLVATMFYTF
jgi:hypothetical protein